MLKQFKMLEVQGDKEKEETEPKMGKIKGYK